MGQAVLAILGGGVTAGRLLLSRKEARRLDHLNRKLNEMPADAADLFDEQRNAHGSEFNPASCRY